MENKAPNTNNQNIEFETPELEVDQKITKKAQLIGVILFVFIALIIAGFSFISKQKSQKIPVEEKKDTKVGTQINTDKLSFSEDNEPQPTPKTENTQTSNQEKTNQKTQDPFSTQEEKLKFNLCAFFALNIPLLYSFSSLACSSQLLVLFLSF